MAIAAPDGSGFGIRGGRLVADKLDFSGTVTVAVDGGKPVIPRCLAATSPLGRNRQKTRKIPVVIELPEFKVRNDGSQKAPKGTPHFLSPALYQDLQEP